MWIRQGRRDIRGCAAGTLGVPGKDSGLDERGTRIQVCALGRVRTEPCSHDAAEPLARPAGPELNGHTPAISVVLPTREEAENVRPLVARLERVLPDLPVEIIFVDDSDDDTPDAIRAIDSSRAVYLIHRRRRGARRRAGRRRGRGHARCARAVRLRHGRRPPASRRRCSRRCTWRRSETGSDLVVASRFCAGGDKGAFGRLRSALSRVSTRAAMLLFPKRLWHVSDPMSGCFLVRREAVDLDRLRPRGFKILLEILVRTPGLRVSEVPFGFGERHAGRDQGLGARGAAVPAPARPPAAGPADRAVRPLHRRGRHRPGGEHAAAGAVRRRGRHLLRRSRRSWRPRDRPCGTSVSPRGWVFAGRDHERSARAARRDVLRDEQRRAGAAGAAAVRADERPRDQLPGLEHPVAGRAHRDPVRRRRRVDLGQGAAPRGRVVQLRHPRASSPSPPRCGCRSCSGS